MKERVEELEKKTGWALLSDHVSLPNLPLLVLGGRDITQFRFRSVAAFIHGNRLLLAHVVNQKEQRAGQYVLKGHS